MIPYKNIKEYKLFGHWDARSRIDIYWVDQNVPSSFSITFYRKPKWIFAPPNMSIPLFINNMLNYLFLFLSSLMCFVSTLRPYLVFALNNSSIHICCGYHSSISLTKYLNKKSGLAIENELNFCQVHKLKLSFKMLGYILFLMFC